MVMSIHEHLEHFFPESSVFDAQATGTLHCGGHGRQHRLAQRQVQPPLGVSSADTGRYENVVGGFHGHGGTPKL